jgi:serine/threonine-protein kinase
MPSEPLPCAGTNGDIPPPQPDQAKGTPENLLDAALAEQRRDWLAGKRPPAAHLLRRYPDLESDPALAAELVYHEFTLRQELGEAPHLEEYLRQFPQHGGVLRLLHQADQLMEQALAPAQPASIPAARFADYDLLEEIGHGGMGVVHKARQRSLGRVVALKMIRAGEDPGAEERQRFDSEARAVAHLSHPNIVQIHEIGEAAGQPFLVLEFVEGGSLADRLDGTPLPASQAASLVGALARAMQHAHEKGIIHRDLKPSNVLLVDTPERWVPKVTDFGLAKRLETSGYTRSGAVLGTPSYMAPEQAEPRGAATDPRTDVYGLGAILYELLTGPPSGPNHRCRRSSRSCRPTRPGRASSTQRCRPTWRPSASSAWRKSPKGATLLPLPWPTTWSGGCAASRCRPGGSARLGAPGAGVAGIQGWLP